MRRGDRAGKDGEWRRHARRTSGITRTLVRGVVALRWPIIAAWIAAAVAASVWLPALTAAPSVGLNALVPSDAAPLRTEQLARRVFRIPLETRTVVVERTPHGPGLPALTAAAASARAFLSSQGDLFGALPVFTTKRSGGRTITTIVYYALPAPWATAGGVRDAAERFARSVTVRNGARAGVTGINAAELERSSIVSDKLTLVELATLAWVLLAIAVHFRALVAPLVGLLAVGVAYVLASRVLAWGSDQLGQTIPQQARPVIVVLVFGIVTDYTIFYLSRVRGRLAEGHERLEAVRRGGAEVTGIVFAAGMTVAAATVAVIASSTTFFATFGPAMAVAALISVMVSITLVPAALAILGRHAYWPRDVATATSSEGGRAFAARRRVVAFAYDHPVVVALALVAALGAGTAGVTRLQLAVPEVRGLPAGSEPRQAYEDAVRGFGTGGVVAPTVVVLRAPGVSTGSDALARFQRLLARQPGVARVVGPGTVERAAEAIGLEPRRARTLFVSSSAAVARFAVVLEGSPYGTHAIDTIRALERSGPALARRAGFHGAQVMFGGDTAIASVLVSEAHGDIARVAPIAIAAVVLVLAIFLRALVAPLYLVAVSTLTVAAALGITGWAHGWFTHTDGIRFFLPFATAVLLLALGSDYTVYLVGRVWQEARERPLREAIVAAGAAASRPITVAGVILAGSFGLLALVPVDDFRVVAFTIGVGLLIDTFLVRTMLVPALLSIVGRRSGWPGRALKRVRRERRAAARN